jgi:hypothetical protein
MRSRVLPVQSLAACTPHLSIADSIVLIRIGIVIIRVCYYLLEGTQPSAAVPMIRASSTSQLFVTVCQHSKQPWSYCFFAQLHISMEFTIMNPLSLINIQSLYHVSPCSHLQPARPRSLLAFSFFSVHSLSVPFLSDLSYLQTARQPSWKGPVICHSARINSERFLT